MSKSIAIKLTPLVEQKPTKTWKKRLGILSRINRPPAKYDNPSWEEVIAKYETKKDKSK